MAQIPLEQGNWRMRVTTTANGKAEPVNEYDECLYEELTDLHKHFPPRLAGAKCSKATQQPRDKGIAYRMQCTGDGFTSEMESWLRVDNPRHFIATVRADSKYPTMHLVVVTTTDGRHTGPCSAISELLR